METLAILGVVVVALVFIAILYGRSKERGKQARKAAEVSSRQTEIATKRRRRNAKGVADDIRKSGL